MLTSRHPIVRATLGMSTKDVGRLRPKRTVLVDGAKGVHLTRVGQTGRGGTYSFRHVCFDQKDSVSVCGREGRLNRGLIGPVLGTMSCSIRRAMFSFVPGATRITFCKLLRKFSGCLGRLGMGGVRTLKRRPGRRRLRGVLS